MTKEELIETLDLAPHPNEGGYFRRTYESDLTIKHQNSSRKLLTSIYYLLTSDSPQGCLHKNKSDIIHFHHSGAAIKYQLITPNGCPHEYILGSDLAKGQRPQLLVKAGVWKASQLCAGEFGLISEGDCESIRPPNPV